MSVLETGAGESAREARSRQRPDPFSFWGEAILYTALAQGGRWLFDISIAWLAVAGLAFLMAFGMTVFQRRFTVGRVSRDLCTGQKIAWWLGTALYAFVLGESGGATAVHHLQITWRATVAESVVAGAGTVVGVGVVLSVGVLSWNIRHVMRLRQLAGGVDSDAVSMISWFSLFLPVGTLLQMGLQAGGDAVLESTGPSWAGIAIAIVRGVLPSAWWQPVVGASPGLVVLVPEDGRTRSAIRTINAIASRYRNGVVTVIARPADAATIAGRFASLADGVGALAKLVPSTLPDLSDSEELLTASDRGTPIAVREIYPAPELWPELVRRLAANETETQMIVVTQDSDERSSDATFRDLPTYEAGLLQRVRNALPVGRVLWRLPARVGPDSTRRWRRRDTVSTVTRTLNDIHRSIVDGNPSLDPTRGVRLVIVVCNAADMARVDFLRTQLHGRRDAHGLQMSIKVMQEDYQNDFSYSNLFRYLVQSDPKEFGAALEIATARLLSNTLSRQIARFTARITNIRIRDEIDILIFASDMLRRIPEQRIWRRLTDVAQEEVFSRTIVALPDGGDWPDSLMHCNFGLTRPKSVVPDTDFFREWARRLLEDDLPGVTPGSGSSPHDSEASIPGESPVILQSEAESHTPSIVPEDIGRMVCVIRTTEGILLGMGVSFRAEGWEGDPVVLTSSRALVGREASSIVCEFMYEKLVCKAVSIAINTAQEALPAVRVPFGHCLIHIEPPFPAGRGLEFADFPTTLQGTPINVIMIGDSTPPVLAVFRGRTLGIHENRPAGLLRYALPVPALPAGSPLFNDRWELVALHASEMPLANAGDGVSVGVAVVTARALESTDDGNHATQ